MCQTKLLFLGGAGLFATALLIVTILKYCSIVILSTITRKTLLAFQTDPPISSANQHTGSVTAGEHYFSTNLCSLQKKNELQSLGTSIHNNSLPCFTGGAGGGLSKTWWEAAAEQTVLNDLNAFWMLIPQVASDLGQSDALFDPHWNKAYSPLLSLPSEFPLYMFSKSLKKKRPW